MICNVSRGMRNLRTPVEFSQAQWNTKCVRTNHFLTIILQMTDVRRGLLGPDMEILTFK